MHTKMLKNIKSDRKQLLNYRSIKCGHERNTYYMKDIQPRTISHQRRIRISNKSKINLNNKTKVIDNLYEKKCGRKPFGNYDYLTTLPKKLYERVSKIIALPPIEEDPQEINFIEKDYTMLTVEEKNLKHTNNFNGSTCSLIQKLEQEFAELNLNTDDEPIALISKKKKKENWFRHFICKNTRQRIIWNSKLYKLENDISEKTVEEQAEDLIDAASERFSNWINSYGTSQTDISKEYIKDLFNVDSREKLLSGIKINPKVIKSVPHCIAKVWGVPQMSITNKFEQKLAERKSRIPPKIVLKHAFGRTIPYSERPWTPPLNYDNIIEPYFPEELLSYEKLFDGILHLKSTKKFINYLQEHSEIQRPEYLEKLGYFEKENVINLTAEDEIIPLYEQFERGLLDRK